MVSCSGLLVQAGCGQGGALQTDVTGLCGARSQCSGRTGLAPAHGVCAFPSTPPRLQAAPQGAGPALRAPPRPKPLRFRFSGTPPRGRLGWACVLCLPGRAAQAAGSLPSALSSGAARLLPSPPASVSARPGAPCVSSGELISGCDPPGGCQPSRISGSLWLETGSLFAVWWGCRLWGRVPPLRLWSLPPPAWGGWPGPQSASSSLVLLRSLFCERAGCALG